MYLEFTNSHPIASFNSWISPQSNPLDITSIVNNAKWLLLMSVGLLFPVHGFFIQAHIIMWFPAVIDWSMVDQIAINILDLVGGIQITHFFLWSIPSLIFFTSLHYYQSSIWVAGASDDKATVSSLKYLWSSILKITTPLIVNSANCHKFRRSLECDGAEVSASGWGSGGPRFQSHQKLTSIMFTLPVKSTGK